MFNVMLQAMVTRKRNTFLKYFSWKRAMQLRAKQESQGHNPKHDPNRKILSTHQFSVFHVCSYSQ